MTTTTSGGGGPLDPKVRATIEERVDWGLRNSRSYWSPLGDLQDVLAAEQYERLRADAALEAFDAAQKQTCLAEDRAYDRKVELEKEREQKAELLEALKESLVLNENYKAVEEVASVVIKQARAAIRKAEGAQ